MLGCGVWVAELGFGRAPPRNLKSGELEHRRRLGIDDGEQSGRCAAVRRAPWWASTLERRPRVGDQPNLSRVAVYVGAVPPVAGLVTWRVGPVEWGQDHGPLA